MKPQSIVVKMLRTNVKFEETLIDEFRVVGRGGGWGGGVGGEGLISDYSVYTV